MTYRLPLTVKEGPTGKIRLIDAAGEIVASAVTYSWHGVSRENDPAIVRENFRRLAEAANNSPPS